MINEYDNGNLVRCKVDFIEEATFVDPTEVVFKFKDPDGVEVVRSYPDDVTLVKDAAGKYRSDIIANISGTWKYRFEGSGNVVASEEGEFYVRRSAFD